MKRFFILLTAFWLLDTSKIPAEIDTNANNLSDLWEQNHNSGDLFPNTFSPTADPDKDGWTNAQEAAAGTDPFDPNPPNGFLRPGITHIPAVFDEPDANGDPVLLSPKAIRVSWTTLPGKKYTLLYSPDLEATSWLPVEDSFIGNGTITEYNFPLANPTKTFWRVKIEDTDSDADGLTDAEENQLGLNAAHADTDGDGVPDKVEITNGTDPNNPDTDGDGLTDGQEFVLGTNPSVVDVLGLVNSGFQDSITDSPDMTFRTENPADLYDQTSVPGWQAEVGQHIEIWDEGGGNRYVELQAHLGAHGIKQTFKMVPGTQITQILRYKGRYNWETYDNAFTLKVQGAAEMKINGVSAALSENLRSKSFMEDDEFDKYTDWHTAVVTITAPTGGTGLAPITLSLAPNTITSYPQEDITYGSFVDLLPIEFERDEDVADGNWQVMTGQLAKALPGQKINLRINTKTLPAGVAISDYDWELPNKVFQEYAADQKTGKLTEIPDADRKTAEMHCYFADSGKKIFTVNCKINGALAVFSTTINIEKPTTTFTSNIGVTKINHSILLILSDPFGSSHGISFTGKVTVPEGWPEGKWNWVQVVTTKRTKVDTEGNTKTFSLNGQPLNGQQLVDTTYPYKPIGGLTTWYDTSTEHTVYDTPQSGLTGYVSVDVSDSFEMFIMFLPDGKDSRYVPTKSVTWSWGGLAKLSDGAWSLTSPIQSLGKETDNAKHPEWSENVRNGGF